MRLITCIFGPSYPRFPLVSPWLPLVSPGHPRSPVVTLRTLGCLLVTLGCLWSLPAQLWCVEVNPPQSEAQLAAIRKQVETVPWGLVVIKLRNGKEIHASVVKMKGRDVVEVLQPGGVVKLVPLNDVQEVTRTK